jgi:uncharacterized protein YdiU (UPF0061 family)
LFAERDEDAALLQALLDALTGNKVDFTLFFRRLSQAQDEGGADPLRSLFADPAACDAWLAQWRARLRLEDRNSDARRTVMDGVNPAFIPRNHRVEAMIDAAVKDGDFAPFETLLTLLSRPFEDQPDFADYADPPREDERVLQTFCGT